MNTVSLVTAAGLLVMSAGLAVASPYGRPTAFQELYPYGDYGARQVSNTTTNTGYRCNGISYGTGAQSCGTATGGPAGGITNRN